MSFRRDQPYNELPTLPPNGEIETKAILKRVIASRAAIEGLKHAGSTIPNQSILLRSIVLQEARSSSEIENVVTTNDELYRAMSAGEQTEDSQTKEVLRYGHAIWEGYARIRASIRLDREAYCELASTILEKSIQVRERPGTRVGNPRTGAVIYTPPAGAQTIGSLLDNLVDFQYGNSEFDPLVRVAIGHYQFEAIHPFVDGNGRVGRVLNILWLVEQGLLDQPVLYLSRAIIESKSDYYAGLRRVTENQDWEGWLSYFLDLVEITAIETRRRIENVRRLIEETKERARQLLPEIYSSELINAIFLQPYLRIAALEAAGIAKRQTASLYLRELERIGLLTSQRRWREVLYVNDALMDALT